MHRPTQFGLTWWGQQWLQALSHIDYDNRLPRGRRYAQQGAVRDMTVDGPTVRARVQGSRPQPYTVAIDVPALTAAEAKRLVDAIATDPALIARLLNRELDPRVLELAAALDIAIFPSQWRDLPMRCSCPDWAVPCKHLAAVIYVLSREIDVDPFRVFSMRGINLLAALKGRGIAIKGAASAARLPTVADVLVGRDVPGLNEGGQHGLPPMIGSNAPLDFTVLPDLQGKLTRVLAAAPPFYAAGDFRDVLERICRQAARSAQQWLDGASCQTAPQAPGLLHPDDRPRLEIEADYTVRVTGVASIETLPALLEALDVVEPRQLADLQPEWSALEDLRLLALHLIARSAVIPQVFALPDGQTALRWLPARLEPAVGALLQRIAADLPDGLLKPRDGRRRRALSSTAQATALCSFMLDRFVRRSVPPVPNGDALHALFGSIGRARFEGLGESTVPSSLQAWLARLHLVRQRHLPILVLEDVSIEAADFELAIAVETKNETLSAPVPLATVLQRREWSKERFHILQTIAILADFHPPLHDYVRQGAQHPLLLPAAELPGFLTDVLPVVRLLGLRAQVPKGLEHALRPQLSMRIKAKAPDHTAYFNMADCLRFEWSVALGDHTLSRSEFETLVASAAGMVRHKGQYVLLDPEALARLRAQLERPPALNDAEVLQTALAGDYAGAHVALDAKARKLIRQLLEAGDVEVPDGIQATLRPYQTRGYAWLYRNARAGLGCVIADDMGLGKTLQVIATVQRLKDEGALVEGKVLVVVPTGLLTNWQKEIARFAPDLTVGVFHGARRELTAERPDILLTTYGVVRTQHAVLQGLRWHLVVVDEAQNIKTPAAAQTKAVKALQANAFIAMSGTPVENRLSEYWSIMDFACRGYLGSLTAFTKAYAVPIQTHRDQHVLARFKRVTAPFLLRRLKTDASIIQDLPAKIEQDQFCALSKAQAALYAAVVKEGLAVIAGTSDTFARQGLVLQLILRLKQICNHPAQYAKQGPADLALSGKAERCMELLDEIHAGQEKVLVFTQFREMGKLLEQWIQARWGQAPLYLHGGVSRAQRDAQVERFQHDRTARVFLLSLKAGGTGLNLTAASNVIHYDLWWNPAVEAQATDRAYRIGQKRNVLVHRLITRGTFEERINDMIQRKRELAELTVGTGERWIGQLGDADLKEIFALDA